MDCDPALLTIAEARAELQAGRLSAVELTEAVLTRTERLNPTLNAYLHIDREGALAQARAADRREADPPPLRGIPICVKDVIDVAGAPTTAGSARWRRLPEVDAVAVSRVRAAGAIVIGKGHTNEFAYGIDGKNPHWGDCCNPFDPARMTGGSSSGPAAATSAGMALAGIGTDTSGSLRVPASFCGLVGVRPTLGLVPLDGVLPLAWSYDTLGPLTRTVADARLMLDALTRTDGQPPFNDPGVGELRGLRVGLPEQLLEAAEPYVASAVADTASHLEALGARVVRLHVELLRYAMAIHLIVQHAEAASVHRQWFDAQRPYYSEPVRTRLEVGGLLPASAYLAAQRARRLLIENFADTMRRLDVLLAPTAPFIAPPRILTEVTIREKQHELRSGLLGCTLAPSQLASPIVSVPIGRRDGLPYGMQIIGRPLSEPLLLRVAAACEQRYEWRERRPSI